MAILSDADYQQIKKAARADPIVYQTLKAWGLSKTTWKAALQAVEDWFTNGFSAQPASSLKASIEAETGACTNTQAKQLVKAWMTWRLASDRGT